MIRKLMATTAIATLIATGASFAQTAPAPTAPVEQATPQVVHADGHLASDIIGQTVYSSAGDDGQNIGSISDIVLSPDGVAEAVVIGVGGFLGLGKKDVAIEYNLVNWTERDGNRYLVVQTTPEALKALPTFDVAAYRPMAADAEVGNTTPATAAELDAAKQAADAGAAMDETPTDERPAVTDATRTSAIDRSAMTEVAAGEIRADDLIGTTVHGAGDESVGVIGDVILSPDGQVDAVTVDVGGFLGLGAKEVAVDFDNLAFMRDAEGRMHLYTPLTKAQLEAQPEYDKTTFVDNRDRQLIIITR